jgi:adenosylcobinamide-phosphate synthase
MAGALGLRLAGPRVYGDTLVDDAWMGEGNANATPADLRRALALYRTACAVQIGVVLLAVIAQL